MSKILIEGNKVIIDGHASDLETCNTLTNLCDELSKSEKFRTVKYESGYGEFESVSECGEKKKFLPSFKLDIIIYSNDGTTKLFETRKIPDVNVEVQSTGLIFNDSSDTNYTYAGGKIFLGLSNKVNSTSATFPVGYKGTVNDIGGFLYIVEADPSYQVNIKSNDGTTTLAQNATVDSVVVTSTGAQLKYGDTVNATYTYSGSKLFVGLATSTNATAPKYKPGDTIAITAETTLYIVENIIIPDHHSSLNELFTNIAAIIREKTGYTASIIADDFPSVIRERLKAKPLKPDGESYLTFSSPNRFTLKVKDTTKHWNGTLEYFSSDRTWTVWNGTTTLYSVDNDSEYVLYLRGTGNAVITGNSNSYRWVLTGSNIACSGNIETLLNYTTVESGLHPAMANYCYYFMFQDCTSLITAPALPATTLANYCYTSMFQGCTSLIQAPRELPATTLATSCYTSMFQGCTSLIQAPRELPATTLASQCYYFMFQDCTSLITAPALPATTLADYCYQGMFQGCTSLIQAPRELPATTLASQCYYDMFQDCTSLITAPALPATTLANYCYTSMFQGCTSLTQAPALPATTLANDCYHNMFYGCTKIKLSTNQTGEYTVAYRIPSSGTGTTANNALYHMFTSTGGTFTGTPSINTTYYLSNTNTVISPPATLISFTIAGESYQAEEGMTWGEWVDSGYNTIGCYYNNQGDTVKTSTGKFININYSSVTTYDVIIANGDYDLSSLPNIE